MSFNKANLQQIRADIATALAAVEKKHGMTLKLGNIKFNDGYFYGKMEATKIGGESKEATFFKANAKFYGIQPDALGKTITSNGKTFTIVGMKSNSVNKPVLVKDATGTTFKMRKEFVASAYPFISLK